MKESLLEFMDDDEILKAEKNWIKAMKEKIITTGNSIFSPHYYLEERVRKLNFNQGQGIYCF